MRPAGRAMLGRSAGSILSKGLAMSAASRYWCTFTCPVRTAGLPNQPVQFQQRCNTLGEPNKTWNVLRELLTNQSKYFRPVPYQWKQEAGFLGRVHNVSNQICQPCRLEYEKERLSLPRTPMSAKVLAAPAPISCVSADAALDTLVGLYWINKGR